MTAGNHDHDALIRQSYREASRAEPEPSLDARILAAAREAVAKPSPRPARWSWLVLPIGAAAVAILATTLVLRTGPTGDTTPAKMAAAPQPSARAERPQTKSTPEPRVADATPARPTDGALPRLPAQPPRHQTETAMQKADSTKARAAAPSLAGNAAEREPAGPSTASLAKGPVASAPEPDAVDAAPADKSAAAAATGAPPGGVPDPEKWLEDIRRLRREGKLEEARNSLAELRRAHPRYAIPQDVRALDPSSFNSAPGR